MHVVHIIPFASRIGGYETQGRLLARATAARGVEVTIATDASHAKATRRLAPEVRVVGIGYRFRRFSRRACSSAVKTATVIHAHALAPLTACVIDAARDRGIPAVVKIATAGDVREFNDPWTNPPQVLDAPQSNPQWLANQQRDMSRAWDVLRGSQCFVALNRAIADELMRTGVTSEQILHLPNAVRIPQRPIDVRPDGRHAVYLGRFEERKRLGDLIEAFRVVRDRVPAATLELVGRASRHDLRSWRNEPGVTMPGPTDDPEAALRRADLFVMASEREGCPNALLEAAALGLPCLATSIPGIREWFRDDAGVSPSASSIPTDMAATEPDCAEFHDEGQGATASVAASPRREMVLIPPGQPARLADAWVRLLQTPEERCALGTAARAAVERQAGLEGMVDRYIDLYERLANGNRGAACRSPRASDSTQRSNDDDESANLHQSLADAEPLSLEPSARKQSSSAAASSTM